MYTLRVTTEQASRVRDEFENCLENLLSTYDPFFINREPKHTVADLDGGTRQARLEERAELLRRVQHSIR